MKSQIVHLLGRHTTSDWSQQELAEFYRVVSVLGSAGIAVEIERGLSDEDEPWFVFCHPKTNDVIVHFARYQGIYIAAIAATGQVLKGQNFRLLVETFLARQPLLTLGSTRHDSVALHPSSLLSTLVATALFLLEHTHAEASIIAEEITSCEDQENRIDQRLLALTQTLLEPLKPSEQREAILTISAIVASLTAIAFEYTSEYVSINLTSENLVNENVHLSSDLSDEDNPDLLGSPSDERATTQTEKLNIQLINHAEELHLQSKHETELPSQSAASLDELLASFTTQLWPIAVDNKDLKSNVTTAELGPEMFYWASEEQRAPQSVGEAYQKGDKALPVNNNDPLAPAPVRTIVASDYDTKDAQIFYKSPHERQIFIDYDSSASLLVKAFTQTRQLTFVATDEIEPQLKEASNFYELLTSALDLQGINTIEANNLNNNTTPVFARPLDANTFQHETKWAIEKSAISDQANELGLYTLIEKQAMAAISFFAKVNPDFKITQFGNDVVMYDADISQETKMNFDKYSWLFEDGSKITIVGILPNTLQPDA